MFFSDANICTMYIADVTESVVRTTSSTSSRRDRNQRRRVNCVVSSWSDWTPCPTSCDADVSWKTRQRDVIRHPQNGGRTCPRRLHRRRRCRPPSHCGTCERWYISKPAVLFLAIVRERKLRYFGHMTRKSGNCLEKRILYKQHALSGRRKEGRPKTSLIDNIITCTGLS